jgi:hypothetical protein
MGNDVAGPAVDYAEKRGVPVIRKSFLNLPLQTGSLSAVTFWAVLEHLINPRVFLEKAASFLRVGGYCFVLVPNFNALAVRLLDAKYRYILPQHVNYFTLHTLQRLASEEPGFQIAEMISTHFNPLVLAQDFLGNGTIASDEARGRLLKRTTAYKENPILAPAKAALDLLERLLGRMHLADNLTMVLQKIRE